MELLYFGRIKSKDTAKGRAGGILFPNLPKAPDVGGNFIETLNCYEHS
jgi:hypothetical protein